MGLLVEHGAMNLAGRDQEQGFPSLPFSKSRTASRRLNLTFDGDNLHAFRRIQRAEAGVR